MKLKLRYKTNQPQVVMREREVELTVAELQAILDQIVIIDFDRSVVAQDVMEYVEGNGEFAAYIKLAGKDHEMKQLINRISFEAHYGFDFVREVDESVIEEGDEVNFRMSCASVVT
ncbi:hypothetical protein [Leptothrix discophora]|uniref:Uncharacterized protein n=1 Tax=Leptothrix discophora TaxID=89 RepID=A0ABT9G4N0_LEPDI|nr:hypothetical protein [Leptothrix discophora]MDP4301361.1 hypothetical protein [Leptothrix discophora]